MAPIERRLAAERDDDARASLLLGLAMALRAAGRRDVAAFGAGLESAAPSVAAAAAIGLALVAPEGAAPAVPTLDRASRDAALVFTPSRTATVAPIPFCGGNLRLAALRALAAAAPCCAAAQAVLVARLGDATPLTPGIDGLSVAQAAGAELVESSVAPRPLVVGLDALAPVARDALRAVVAAPAAWSGRVAVRLRQAGLPADRLTLARALGAAPPGPLERELALGDVAARADDLVRALVLAGGPFAPLPLVDALAAHGPEQLLAAARDVVEDRVRGGLGLTAAELAQLGPERANRERDRRRARARALALSLLDRAAAQAPDAVAALLAALARVGRPTVVPDQHHWDDLRALASLALARVAAEVPVGAEEACAPLAGVGDLVERVRALVAALPPARREAFVRGLADRAPLPPLRYLDLLPAATGVTVLATPRFWDATFLPRALAALAAGGEGAAVDRLIDAEAARQAAAPWPDGPYVVRVGFRRSDGQVVRLTVNRTSDERLLEAPPVG